MKIKTVKRVRDKMLTLKIIPAVLSVSRKDFVEKLELVKSFDFVQIDICDGKFVDTKTVQPLDFYGLDFPKSEFHLMVKDIERYFEHLLKFNADVFVFHFEACKDDSEILRLIKHIKNHCVKVGIAINPETSILRVKKFLKFVDKVLVMTVHPKMQGQKFIVKMLSKIKALRKLDKNLDIEVDGGINADSILLAKKAGANLFVVGSAIVRAENPLIEFKRLSNMLKK